MWAEGATGEWQERLVKQVCLLPTSNLSGIPTLEADYAHAHLLAEQINTGVDMSSILRRMPDALHHLGIAYSFHKGVHQTVYR